VKVTLVDLGTNLRMYFDSLDHPNPEGDQKYAEAIFQTFKSYFG
jgi:hypothetical protein